MERQVSSKVPRLSSSHLRDLGITIEDACSAMESLGIPDSLIHLDANPGNVLINGSRCAFTDWAEAGIGNPFLTFEVLSSALVRNANTQGSVDDLKVAYRESWVGALSTSQIERAFGLAPLLAIVAYLYGRGTWLRSERRNDPHVQSYSRGLARHMDRAARVPRLMEALCH
jgi:aminoglycoside phosphotransferase (APT) family kinase protein